MKKSRKREAGNRKYRSLVYFLLLTFYFLLLTCHSFAEDTIDVLIVEDPYASLLSEKAEKMGILNGELYINGYTYTGFIDVRKGENGLHFINKLPFERYIEGVVAAEIGKDWEKEALKAQAVISRTYAVYQKNLNNGKDYHITSSVQHQVYKGSNTDRTISESVRETAGEILTYRGSPIKAFYHSACTGRTELPEEVWGEPLPYINSVICEGGNSPYEHWVRRFTLDELEKTLGIKEIRNIAIASFTSTGRVKTLKITTGDSVLEIKGVDLRKLLGYKELPSTQFSVTVSGETVIFEGSGYGHGVGLSQWGALALAKEGKNYKEILQYYYPGTVLQKQQ